MFQDALPQGTVVEWVVIPAFIFAARVVDVSLGTIRILLIGRGHKVLSAGVGFLEVLIWLAALGQIMQNLHGVMNLAAYAAGFAAGNYVGVLLDQKLAIGLLSVQVITRRDASPLVERLRQEAFGVTTVAARGAYGNVRMLYTVVQRRDTSRLLAIIRSLHPHCFVCIHEVRTAEKGVFPPRTRFRPRPAVSRTRKGK